MANKKAKIVLYRRKREQKTNYRKRLRLLESGKLRLTFRTSNTKFLAQVVSFDTSGDKIIVGVDSSALKKNGWNYSSKNFPAAYLTGLLLAQKAKRNGVKEELILDTGLESPSQKGKTFAFLKGVLDGGLEVRHGSEDIFPEEEKMSGIAILDYASSL